MNPLTHFFAGWVAFERWLPTRRDKAIVVLSGLAPDVDGLGMLVDLANEALHRPETMYYHEYHRLLAHGLPAAVAFAAIGAALASTGRRVRVALLTFAAVHLHLLCDLVGSRGTEPEDLWPIHYMEPLAASPVFVWSHQWPLVGWQNFAITVVLLFVTMRRAARVGASPVGIFSRRGDVEFVAVMRKWRRQLTGRD